MPNANRAALLKHWGRLLFIPPLVIGLLIAALLVKNRKTPELEAAEESRRMLRVIQVPVVDVVPRVVGYGTAAPGQTWRAVTQVSGRIVQIHPELESGSVINKNELLLKIDPTEYEYAVAQLEAEVKQATAQLKELTRNEENYRASLKIEQDALKIAKRELQRLQGLAERNVTSRAQLDSQEKIVLSQEQRIQEQTNLLNLLPTRKQTQEANVALRQAQLAQAKLDLNRTEMRAPFDCRLGEVALELDQFVSTGETLFQASSIDLAEVEAQVSPRDVNRLIRSTEAPAFSSTVSMDRVREIFNVQAVVEMATTDIPVKWSAKFMRIRETLDPQTRSLSIVVGVEKPYEQVIPGKRPPLLEGTYCRVTLTGPKHERQVVMPRSAMRDSHVYVLDAENRLRRKAVRIEFVQGQIAAIADGLRGGETLVVSDPTPAITGMLVKPVEDNTLLRRIVADARGEDAGNRQAESRDAQSGASHD